MQRKKPSTTTDTKLTLPAPGVTEVLTVAETAALLKVPASSIYEWSRFRSTQRTPIPHRKVGKYLRFLRSEVEAWLLGLPQAVNTRKRKYTRKPDVPDAHAAARVVCRGGKGRAA
jgi:excisionase family DNA binding protein